MATIWGLFSIFLLINRLGSIGPRGVRMGIGKLLLHYCEFLSFPKQTQDPQLKRNGAQAGVCSQDFCAMKKSVCFWKKSTKGIKN